VLGWIEVQHVPLYEYQCRSCGHQFEALVRGDRAPEKCPSCGEAGLERLISLFAVESDGTRQASLSKQRKVALSVEKDKAIAHEEYVNKHHD